MECHIYTLGGHAWGKVSQDPRDGSFNVYTKDDQSKPVLTGMVEGTGPRRTVTLVAQRHQPGRHLAVASARIDGQNAYFQVECFSDCDIVMTVVLLSSIDRMSVNEHVSPRRVVNV